MQLNLLTLDRSYILSFRQEFHILLMKYNHISSMNASRNYKNNNFLQNTRTIHRLHDLKTKNRQSCIIEYTSNMNSKLWNHIIILFASQFSWLVLQNYADTNAVLQTHNSVQALTIFCETRLINTNLSVNTDTKKYFHPEILVRIMRKSYKDTCILNLLRIVIYYNYTEFQLKNQLFIKYSHFFNKQLLNFLLLQLDQFIRTSLYHLSIFVNTQSINSNKIIIEQKWRIFEMQMFFTQLLRCSAIRYQSCYESLLYTTHYTRYNDHALLWLQGNDNCATNLNRRLTRFYERRICSSKRYIRVSKQNFNIEWFKTTVEPQQIQQYGKFVEYSSHFQIYLENIIIPFIICKQILVTNLHIHRICKLDGYPLSKTNWISLDDVQICGYFQLIYIRLYCYYSGAYNQHIFNYLYYIIKYSCIKTIAFKHKKSFRFVLKLHKKLEIFNQMYPITKTNINSVSSLRVWHVDVIYISEH